MRSANKNALIYQGKEKNMGSIAYIYVFAPFKFSNATIPLQIIRVLLAIGCLAMYDLEQAK